jgi:hypothetical protein
MDGSIAAVRDAAMRTLRNPVVLVVAGVLCWPHDSQAYIGPGAGFAFATSFFALLLATLAGAAALLSWPFRWAKQKIKGVRGMAGSRVRRVIVLGFDSQDPDLRAGSWKGRSEFRPPARPWNVCPAADHAAVSRRRVGVARPTQPRGWIFDFLVPNRRSYLPELCPARVHRPARAALGRCVPLGPPRVETRRRSEPFWKILADHGIFQLRVPITFPPDRFDGVLLAMRSRICAEARERTAISAARPTRACGW